MANIKDVAKAAGVSPTTVSLIINGKAKERRISDETAEKVYQVMNDLNYHPNISARQLRTDVPVRAMIAFFWPNDFRSNVIGSFITNFPSIRDELGFDCDLVIRSFKNGEIEKYTDAITKNSYSGIIVGGASLEDVAYLETLKTRTPVVIINRKSEKFSTVGSDNVEIGLLAARLIKQKGYNEAAIFTSDRPYMATGLRVQGFMYACSEIDINIKAEWIFKTENSVEGGARAATAYIKAKGVPKVIFCDSDFMALGVLSVFYHYGIKVPDDVEILAVQFMGEEYTKYSVPPLTTISMPNARILKAALAVIQKQIGVMNPEPVHEILPTEIEVRETFK